MSKTKYIYKLSFSNPDKVDGRLEGACFSSAVLAIWTMNEWGFYYSEEAELWHNGITEGWISKIPIKTEPILYDPQ